MNRVRRFLINAKGTSAVEFALVLPLLSVLLFGFYEAGRLFWNYNVVSNSARDAARFAARMPMASCASGLDGGDVTKVQQLARTGTVGGTGAPLVPNWTSNSSVQVAVSCVDNPISEDPARTYMGRYADTAQIPKITVTASAPFSVLFGGLFPGLTLTAVAVNNSQAWTE